MLQKIRMYFYNHYLKQRLYQHKVTHQAVNLNDAKTIAILFDATDESILPTIKSYAKKLEKQQKKITLLGFIDSSRANEHANFPYFSRKDINWYFQPVHNQTKEFTDRDFDILINAFLMESATLEYIATFSKAKFRVGPYFSEKTHCFDLMININPKEDNVKETEVETSEVKNTVMNQIPYLEEYFKKVNHYLTIINQ